MLHCCVWGKEKLFLFQYHSDKNWNSWLFHDACLYLAYGIQTLALKKTLRNSSSLFLSPRLEPQISYDTFICCSKHNCLSQSSLVKVEESSHKTFLRPQMILQSCYMWFPFMVMPVLWQYMYRKECFLSICMDDGTNCRNTSSPAVHLAACLHPLLFHFSMCHHSLIAISPISQLKVKFDDGRIQIRKKLMLILYFWRKSACR